MLEVQATINQNQFKVIVKFAKFENSMVSANRCKERWRNVKKSLKKPNAMCGTHLYSNLNNQGHLETRY